MNGVMTQAIPQPTQKRYDDNAVIVLRDIFSEEQRFVENKGYIPIIRGVSFSIMPGELWGIGSGTPEEADVITRIIGNTTAYLKGYCRLGRFGVVQEKRLILPHIFNIDNADMLIERITVLEQLMLLTMHNSVNHSNSLAEDATRQGKLLDLLIELGLADISLSLVSSLSREEKLILELVIAFLSNAQIITFNTLRFELEQNQIIIVEKIAKMMRKADKTLVIATRQPKFIGIVCDHVVYIRDGKAVFTGTVADLCEHSDMVSFVLTSKNAQKTAEAIEYYSKVLQCDVAGDSIFVNNRSKHELTPELFYKFLAKYNIEPDMIKINRGRVENAFNELSRDRNKEA